MSWLGGIRAVNESARRRFRSRGSRIVRAVAIGRRAVVTGGGRRDRPSGRIERTIGNRLATGLAMGAVHNYLRFKRPAGHPSRRNEADSGCSLEVKAVTGLASRRDRGRQPRSADSPGRVRPSPRGRQEAGAAGRRGRHPAVGRRGRRAAAVRDANSSGYPAFGQGGLARQLHAVLVVHGDRLHQHRIADPADVRHAGNIAIGQLADVDQAVLAGKDLDEGPEFLDRGDPALVDPADLHALGHGHDLVAGRLGPRGLEAGERDDAAVLDVDLGAGLFLEPTNRLAAGADDQADLLGIDLDLDQPRRIGGNLLARPLDRPQHRPEDLQPGLVGLLQGLADDLLGDALDS